MTVKEDIQKKKTVLLPPEYELIPPDGGWGHVITISMTVFMICSIVPLTTFGMVFGSFLASIGDETSGTSLVNGIFNTVASFTGLIANQVLQKMSCRKVGLIGAILFFISIFGTIFVTNLIHMIITFAILQGLGFGLMMPASYSAFNFYFDKKKNLMMAIAQAVCVLVMMLWPAITDLLLDTYGFRGTVAIFAALSLNCIPAMAVLQPVEWHMRKRKIHFDNEVKTEKFDDDEKKQIKIKVEEEPLLDESDQIVERRGSYVVAKPRPSIVSIGSYAMSVGGNLHKLHKEDEELTKWQAISKALDLALFKDPIYVNISIGLSLSLNADQIFIPLMPMLLANMGFTASDVTQMMTIFFASDLACRIMLSVLSAITTLQNRLLLLGGAFFSAVFRIAFVINPSSIRTTCVLAVLGFLRCFIQTPLPLVIADKYPDRFPTAFSLYMVVNGVVSLILGPLIGVVKRLTQSDESAVHLLTAAYLLCAIPWISEIAYLKIFRRNQKQLTNETSD